MPLKNTQKMKNLRNVVEDIVFDDVPAKTNPASLKREVEERYAFVQSVFAKIVEQAKSQPVRIKNFGTFFVYKGKPTARNPRTGEIVKVKEPLSLKVKMSTKANKEINRS
ncbi:HU family DNA-binding protein [Alteromonas sp. 14N.309.X.WAT.G.H12]|uniref:HU family DNA-binding protein n=1 Tax=Alteromonas sp. 14N.309.X.WAT.G.H12 TaxID=3120824 RepID=UPI002FD2E301